MHNLRVWVCSNGKLQHILTHTMQKVLLNTKLFPNNRFQCPTAYPAFNLSYLIKGFTYSKSIKLKGVPVSEQRVEIMSQLYRCLIALFQSQASFKGRMRAMTI